MVTFVAGTMCQTNECSPNPCANGGQCVPTPNGHSCRCPNEFFGDHCEFDKNPCAVLPCLNQGTCVPKNKQEYYCECEKGMLNYFFCF